MNSRTVQFPLPLLAFGEPIKERLDVALCHALVVTGRHRAATLSEAESNGILASVDGPDYTEQDDLDDYLAVILGGHFCGVKLPSVAIVLREYGRGEQFLARWRAQGRTVPMVRVGTSLLFEARDGKGISYRDFAVLCAVNAGLGNKAFAAITQPRVRAGMLGYSSSTWLFDEEGDLTRGGEALLAEREDEAVPLSRKQVRTTLDRLERRHFFARFDVSPRRTYFSRSLTRIELGEELLRREEAVGDERRTMNELREKIRRVKTANRTLRRAQSRPKHGPQTGPLNVAWNAALNVALNEAENPPLRGDFSFPEAETQRCPKSELCPDASAAAPTREPVRQRMAKFGC